MKKALLLIIALLSSSFLFSQETMKLVYFNDYPPFSWEENGEMKGILVDVLTETLQNQMGISISHKGYPWARAQYIVKMNDADAFATVPTDERRSYTNISTEPVILVTFTIFISKDSTQKEALGRVKTISDLADFNHVHYIGSGWAKQNLGDMSVYWTPVLEKALLLIAENRFDVFIDASQVIQYNINKLGYKKQIIELPQIIDSASFNLCIGKNSSFANVLPEFNRNIIELRENGKLEEIYNKYK